METCRCGIPIEEGKEYYAYDLQKGYEQIAFCSEKCRNEWISHKKTTMWATVIIGVILAILLCTEMGITEIMFVFLPYMISEVAHGLKDIFNGGTVGEIFSFAVVLLGTITVIYPAYKLFQEIKQYNDIKNS